MRRFLGLLIAATLSIAFLAAWSPAQAQFGKLKDKVKQKVEQKVDKKVDEKIDNAIDGGGEKGSEEAPAAKEEGGEAGKPVAAGPKGGTATAEDMSLFTKYDFVPGDKVIFYDDLSREEMGEFPSRWSLDRGVFEITKKGNRNWIMCSDNGFIRPKTAVGPLPPKYTIEWDIYPKKAEAWGHHFCIEWLDAQDAVIGEFFVTNTSTHIRILGKDLANKDVADLYPGIHTMRVMATKTTLKCYVDNERVANVPAIEEFKPVALRLRVNPGNHNIENPMLFGTFRYAEGGKTLKEQLDEAGKIVTHGILFDSGSAKIKAESCKTLADIGGLLTDSPALRLSIEGHTDSDGADAANITLSQARADAVKTYLVDVYKIDAGRLETKGWGEGKAIDTNDTAEGKANNRRVELVKL
jgi:OmpA-OmpF porin, OOP family